MIKDLFPKQIWCSGNGLSLRVVCLWVLFKMSRQFSLSDYSFSVYSILTSKFFHSQLFISMGRTNIRQLKQSFLVYWRVVATRQKIFDFFSFLLMALMPQCHHVVNMLTTHFNTYGQMQAFAYL